MALPRLFVPLLILGPLLAFTPITAHASTVSLEGAPGNAVLDGGTREFNDADPNVIITFSGGGVPAVGIAVRTATENWAFGFAPPAGGLLDLDWYPEVDTVLEARGLRGSVVIQGPNPGCSSTPGRFVVREIGFAPNSQVVDRLAIDFEVTCNRNPAVLRGFVRWNSNVPIRVSEPTAFAGVDRQLEEGSAVTLNAATSMPGNSALTSYAWRQVSGTSATLGATNAAALSVTLPALGTGVSDPLVFEVRVTNAAGLTDTDTVTVLAHDTNRPPFLFVADSPAGEYVGLGRQYRYTGDDTAMVPTAPDPISGPSNLPHRIAIRVIPTIADRWNLSFNIQSGTQFVPGNYEDASRTAPLLPSQSAMDITSQNRGCNRVSGRYVVLEAEYDVVAARYRKLAIDFEQSCLDQPAPPLKGALRLNSTVPLVRDRPDAAAGSDQLVSPGAAVQLDGSRTIAGTGSIVSWRWRQIDGPAVTLATPTQPSTSFVAPSNVPATVTLVFELEVTSSNGQRHTDTVTVTVRGSGIARSFFRFVSDPNDAVGGGRSDTHGEDRGVMRVLQSDPNVFFLQWNGTVESTQITWTFQFRPPVGEALGVGNYSDVQRMASSSPKRAGMAVLGGLTNTGCGLSIGQFTILELSFDPVTRVIDRLAVDVAQRCRLLPNQGWLRGQLRFNSTVPALRRAPTAVAGRDRQVLERDDVDLDGGFTWPGEGSISAWQWTQVSGPAAALQSAASARTRFVAPVIQGDSADLVFDLTATSSNGERSTDRMTVRVGSKRAPRSYVLVDGQPGAFIGNGIRNWLLEDDGALTVTNRSVEQAAYILFEEESLWDLYFLSQAGVRLSVGTYPNSTRFFFGGRTSPSMTISGRGRACNESTGTFKVLDAAYNAANQFERLAVDFEQFCDGETAPTRGEVRYRTILPDANAGSDIPSARAGTSVALDGSQSSDVSGRIVSYRWRQVSGTAVGLTGSDASRAQFTSPAATGTEADRLVFELLVEDDSGYKDRDLVTVAVAAQPAPTVTLSVSATSATVNQSVTLNWSSTDATGCTASGGVAGDGWSGSRSTSGSASVTAASAGSVTYRLNCTAGGPTAEAVVSVSFANPPVPPPSGGGGGGGGGGGRIDALTLLLLWIGALYGGGRAGSDRSAALRTDRLVLRKA
jgi:hypothetical protein